MACGVRLPAAAHAILARERLPRGLPPLLAAVQAHLEHAHREDEQREEGDEDEPRVRHDLVVRYAEGALAAVMGEGGRREHEKERQREQEWREGAAHHVSNRIAPGAGRAVSRARWVLLQTTAGME